MIEQTTSGAKRAGREDRVQFHAQDDELDVWEDSVQTERRSTRAAQERHRQNNKPGFWSLFRK